VRLALGGDRASRVASLVGGSGLGMTGIA